MESPVIQKIRKLHALAERAGTEHEAALAAELMQELCRKYNVDPAALFGDRWQSSRTRRIVTEMRIETERKVYESKTWVQEIEHIFGPCLSCAVEIKYETHGYRFGKKWVQEQFEPNTRAKLVGWLEKGAQNRFPSFGSLRSLLCQLCESKYSAIRAEKLKDLQLKREQKERLRTEKWQEECRREEWLRTWRNPNPAEFKRTEAGKLFFAYLGAREYRIQFRWRISNRCQCRGSNPGAAVGMWVNGRLVAHYYGWDLPAEDRYDSEYQDRFGTGFELWLERKFQNRLLRLQPDVAWSVLDRQLMDQVDTSQGWLVHVTWHDGQKYAKVGPLPTLVQVADFAWNRMRMRVMGADFQPVHKTAEAAHA